ncbi:cupin domain-containing protein [Rubrolithibacter danxiaensis]|uniref:cupin domain-containing protein n=1 Tax=Rubrolithibacter danxiaensis TaxID=3390805 RepID=UPI003BF90AA8
MNKPTEVIHGHIIHEIMPRNKNFPNNAYLPLLVYKGALRLHPADEPEAITALFADNNWLNSWKDGIFDYHHYHSNTHEVLGVFCGRADVEFGGPEGVCVELVRGDVVVIPAGVAHKRIFCTTDFLCIGAYPNGKEYDIKYGKEEELAEAGKNIKNASVPEKDPVFGGSGPVLEFWSKKMD